MKCELHNYILDMKEDCGTYFIVVYHCTYCGDVFRRTVRKEFSEEDKKLSARALLEHAMEMNHDSVEKLNEDIKGFYESRWEADGKLTGNLYKIKKKKFGLEKEIPAILDEMDIKIEYPSKEEYFTNSIDAHINNYEMGWATCKVRLLQKLKTKLQEIGGRYDDV